MVSHVFTILGVIFWVTALGACTLSKSAMQETVAMLQICVGAVFFVGAAIIDELRKINRPAEKPVPGPGDLKPKKRFKLFE